MATFSVQIQALVGSVTESEIDTWCTEGAKVIISNLPKKLKEECSTLTNLYIGNTDTVMDLDLSGEILYVTRENADSGYHTPCRKINAKHGDLASDSGNIIHYATATDPVYWTGSDSGGDPKLFVKPTPTAVQPAKIYHISYPSVDADVVSAIVNFPDEAEYLIVLYAAVKVLQNKMNEMQASIVHSDQDGSWTTANTSGENQGWEQVKYWIETEEDNELAQIQIAALSAELQQFVTEYQWYQGQQAKLQQDYDKGLAILKGGQQG